MADEHRHQVPGNTDACDSIICSDVIFVLLNESLNRIDPIFNAFAREAKALNNDMQLRHSHERVEVHLRAFEAKEQLIDLMWECDDKLEFLRQLQVRNYSAGVSLFENGTKIRFL